MRIALVTESFYPAVDGTTRTVKHVVDRLVDTGHEVLVVAPGPGLASYRGCRVARVRPLDPPPARPRLGRQVRDALAAFAPDLVHVTSPGKLGRRALKHAGRLGVPAMVVQQSPVDDAERWCRTVRDRADRVVATCRWTAAMLGGLDVDAPMWEPGVDTAAFGPQLRDAWLHDKWARTRSKGGGRVVVGHVGSLHKRHGVRRLVDVARVPGTRLVVIGDGPQRRWLADQVPDARLVPAMGTGELAAAMASLDVLVHPGTEETCCHVLREAAASGVPVVAPAAGGTPDVVRHERTGLLYDPDEPRDLRRAVATLAGDTEYRARLGRQAREAAVRRGWTAAVDELVAVHYDAVLGARVPAA
jgi:phosphatidylinositol alpha 1,6-mannosyltransferase